MAEERRTGDGGDRREARDRTDALVTERGGSGVDADRSRFGKGTLSCSLLTPSERPLWNLDLGMIEWDIP